MRDKPSPTPTTFETADRRASIVMISGGATTVLALVGVYALGRSGENVMGWYGNYVIPVGALLVGAVASSGYGVAAWRTGLKLERPMFWAIAAQLAASYFVAQYVEFRQGGAAAAGVSFWAWFDAVTRAFAWRERNGGSGEAFGVFGYAMRALELAGHWEGALEHRLELVALRQAREHLGGRLPRARFEAARDELARHRRHARRQRALATVSRSSSYFSLCLGFKHTDQELGLTGTNLWLYPDAQHDLNTARFEADPGAPFPMVYVSFPSAKAPRR